VLKVSFNKLVLIINTERFVDPNMLFNYKNPDAISRALSYLTVIAGFFSLAAADAFSLPEAFLISGLFLTGWLIEETRWQLSERFGTILIILAIPLFYLGWKMQLFGYSNSGLIVVGILSRLILVLTIIKILQKKTDRDWIFLYLMSFFQVLLAAGLSISALYLASFIFYLFVSVCAIIAFEIRKTSKTISDKTGKKTSSELIAERGDSRKVFAKKLPLTATALIVLIFLLALPMFFLLPRVGGAGLGGNQNSVTTSTGFSDSVNLGEIGKIQQNDQIVMRVRLETANPNLNFIRWRGVALDTFDNRSWKKSRFINKESFDKSGRDYIQINYATSRDNLATQTFYLEPIDTSVLFALPRAVIVQGNFPVVYKDTEDGISFQANNSERISYQVVSDTTGPNPQNLRRDNESYKPELQRYLQLPNTMDSRISQLAKQVTENSSNRYDKAKALEIYLQNNFGYTLDLKATGDEPVADFLFNIREGHCEYFATAMAVMLRTQGIATRVVNGFQQGEYNETAGVYVVKQRNAHSWVEVYFPGENAWVPFDPTPFAGQTLESNASTGILGKFNNYVEALETFWIQYFVAYDNQGQRSLFRSVKNGLVDYQAKTSTWLKDVQSELSEWWKEARGDKGFETSAKAIGYGIAYFIAAGLGAVLLVFLYRKIIKLKIWQNLFFWIKQKNEATVIEFYERMQTVLASKGFRREPHQTPLEFAYTIQMPEAVSLTEKYNRVRFGEKNLSNDEAKEIESWLENLENNSGERAKI
jgi:transglutaminase-like putative cysteine protease